MRLLDRFGIAVTEERRFDRRLVALEDYLRTEYGSTSGMERYVAEANHNSSPRSGLRTFLARIAWAVVKPQTQVAKPAAPVELTVSEDCGDVVAAASVARAT
ncbi:MAG: hypothetical protein R3291_02415, partial [Thermoplasmata archaeon]|nr:hypothetical protein [Thermoplasmata archaeon]